MEQIGNRGGVGLESLESRQLFAGIAQVGSIGYLLSDNGTQVQRYDVNNQQWLTPVKLANSPGGATASLVDGDGIYVAYDRSVVRYSLDGTQATHLLNANSTVHDIHSDGNLLFLNQSVSLYARFISVNKSTNAIIDSMENYVHSAHGSSISTSTNTIFGRTVGVSPADIAYVSYDDAGHFGAAGDGPYHGDYPSASTTWTFPLGNKVVDSSGGVYSAPGLTRLNSFGTSITDIRFVGNDVPIVLSGKTLTAYSSAVLPTGSKTLALPATQILVNGTNVIAFNPDATQPNRYTTQIVALADLKAPQPGLPVNPVGLSYTPDDIEVGADGTLLILDRETQSVFRWNPQTQQYGATIPLVSTPTHMAYAAATNTLYVAYSTGLINKIDLGAAKLVEQPFVTLPSSPLGLAAAGKFLFAADGSGAWNSHYTISPEGTIISAVDWNYYSRDYVWSAANSKMYFLRDDTSPNDLLSEPIDANGQIGRYIDSPLHTSTGFQHPVRVSPDGKIVILGSGMVHDAVTLARQTGGLANSVADIAWLNGAVYTVRDIAGYAQFQQWTGSTFAPGVSSQFAGKAVALLSVNDKLIGVYRPASGVPTFRVMDGNFKPISVPPPAVTVAVTAPSAVVEGSLVPVSATPSNPNAIIQWDFDYDGQTFTADATGAAPALVAPDGPATRTIAARAYADGAFGPVVTVVLNVQNAAPTAAFIADSAVEAGRPSTVRFMSPIDAVADDLVGLRYSFDFNNDGDFTDAGDVAGSSLPIATFTFAGPGTYAVAGRVTDKDGGSTDYVTNVTVLPPPPTNPASVELQAEAAALFGGTAVGRGNGGYTGAGYADFAGQGSGVEWTLTRPAAGAAGLTFRYANGASANRPLAVYVNNVLVDTLPFAPTGGWTKWNTVSISAALVAGANTIKLLATTTVGGGNVDSLTVTTATVPPPPTGVISGFVFDDADKDGLFDAGETRPAGRTVFIDADNDGVLDASEVRVLTTTGGEFRFADLPAGDYRVRQVLPANSAYSTPAANVALANGQTVNGVAIGTKAVTVTPPPAGTASISGTAYTDNNKNGKFDSGDGYAKGAVIFIDTDNDGRLDAGELSTQTDTSGKYKFTGLTAGTYRVRRVLPTGYTYSTALLNLTLTAGQAKTGASIGVKKV